MVEMSGFGPEGYFYLDKASFFIDDPCSFFCLALFALSNFSNKELTPWFFCM
jgi:hypothetical protein